MKLMENDMEKSEYEKMCAYCEYASPLYNPGQMICKKRGVVPVAYSCRKFVYDPMKRTVKRIKIQSGEPEQFDFDI